MQAYPLFLSIEPDFPNLNILRGKLRNAGIQLSTDCNSLVKLIVIPGDETLVLKNPAPIPIPLSLNIMYFFQQLFEKARFPYRIESINPRNDKIAEEMLMEKHRKIVYVSTSNIQSIFYLICILIIWFCPHPKELEAYMNRLFTEVDPYYSSYSNIQFW